jgi:hypothetical protein
VVGSIGEVGEHLRARVMLRVGWMGLEEHQRQWSTVAKEWRRWQARVEWRELDSVIASGSRGAAASQRQGGGDEGVEASGEGEWCGIVRWLPREEERRRLPWTDSVTVTHGVATACAARGASVATWNQQLAVDRQRDGEQRR